MKSADSIQNATNARENRVRKTNNPCGASVILAVIILVAIVHGANGVTYTVSRLWTDGIHTASLVGTVDVPLGNYTIMNGGADPFTNVSLTLTLNGSPAFLYHTDTSLIVGTGQFFIDATLSSLTFDTANADSVNPTDLQFYDATNTNQYLIGYDGAPGFEAGYHGGVGVVANLTFPVVFGTAANSVPETGSTLALLSLVLLGMAAARRRLLPTGCELVTNTQHN